MDGICCMGQILVGTTLADAVGPRLRNEGSPEVHPRRGTAFHVDNVQNGRTSVRAGSQGPPAAH